MRRFHCYSLALALSMAFAAFPAIALAHSGHTVWGAWRFDWEVKDSAGLALRDVYYNNVQVFYKASVPVIRVQYDSSCGPYADQISWSKLLKISNCGDAKVCQTSYTSGGVNWLEIGVLAKIGEYRIYQAWYLSDDGQIDVRMWSRGLHCEINHNHHPYWRLDTDINGSDGDQVFVRTDGSGNEGWGTDWHKYTNELNDLKQPNKNRLWYVRDNNTDHGLWIIPGPDGTTDSFSTKDAAPRRYKDSEDEPWPFGAWGHLGYDNNEDIQETDSVFWYVAHLRHLAAGGPTQWEWAGPLLKVHR